MEILGATLGYSSEAILPRDTILKLYAAAMFLSVHASVSPYVCHKLKFYQKYDLQQITLYILFSKNNIIIIIIRYAKPAWAVATFQTDVLFG